MPKGEEGGRRGGEGGGGEEGEERRGGEVEKRGGIGKREEGRGEGRKGAHLGLELQAMLESLLIMKWDSGVIKVLDFIILPSSQTCMYKQ
jgi:hypothetical protein